ncbi:hypothetical protein DEA8626_00717 [Defluviimonas aquaemixtae]|uniref:Uncharacterized protein n=2 Tax=Albidovulum aquaemixtae TaxID=1542388 RepID=A0A2R8B3F5_9RHOB|nr:hypothetical protein DEA8626_00717 [Defluviimonas aquaemixtae]
MGARLRNAQNCIDRVNIFLVEQNPERACMIVDRSDHQPTHAAIDHAAAVFGL